MRARIAPLLLLLALVATVAALTGCGAGLDPVAQAAVRTSDASSARFSMSIELDVPGAAGTVSVAASGAYGSGGRLQLDIDLSRIAQGAGEAAGLGRLRMVEDDTAMYLSGGGLSRILPAGKSWARVDLARVASAAGLDVSTLAGGQNDPRVSLSQLREAGNVVEIGPATVRGAEVTRYSVLADLRKGLDHVAPASRAALQALLDRLEAAGTRYVPADVWIGGDGYLRRFRMSIPNYLGAGSSYTMTMDLYDFGAPVTIEVPPEWQVADLTRKVSGALGG